MKKLFSSIVVILLCVSVWAFDYSEIDVQFAPGRPLYVENRAYVFSNSLSFKYMFLPQNEDSIPNTILVSDGDKYIEKEYKGYDPDQNRYWHLKGAANTSIIRASYENIKAEFFIEGGLNSSFAAFGGFDMLGMDGLWGLGTTFSFKDKLVLRLGIHHFSGHWGDEILKKYYEKHNSLSNLTEYTRNNSWLFNIGYNLSDSFRLTSEFELPMKSSWIRPAAHVPRSTMVPNKRESTSSHVYKQEGLSEKNNDDYPDSYKAMRVGLGAEYMFKTASFGDFYTAFDLQLHQDGKIDLEGLEYKEDRCWEKEIGIAVGYILDHPENSPEVSIELSYRKGRYPLTNFFFKKTGYVAVGIVITE